MSWYFPEKRVLFLHIPRTGGTWIKECLYQSGVPMEKWGRIGEGQYRPQKHTIIPHIRRDLLQRVDQVYSLVRHPIPYYVSVWRFTTRKVEISPERMHNLIFARKDPAAISEAVLRWKPNFEQWLEEMLEEEPGWVTRWFERFVGPPRGEFCHFIGRTETIADDLKRMMTMMGYERNWRMSLDKIKQIHHAKNRVREVKVPHVWPSEELCRRIENSERVAIRRFYEGEGRDKRIYRTEEGEPIWESLRTEP